MTAKKKRWSGLVTYAAFNDDNLLDALSCGNAVFYESAAEAAESAPIDLGIGDGEGFFLAKIEVLEAPAEYECVSRAVLKGAIPPVPKG